MRTNPGLVLVVLASLAAGCTNRSNNGGSNLTPADVRLQIALAQCQLKARCGSIGASEEKQCETDAAAALQSYPEAYSQVDAVAAKRLTFDANAAEACIDAFKAVGCTVDQQIVAYGKCDPVFKAAVAIGAMCQADAECSGGYCDGATSDGCNGTCKALLNSGDTCDTANSHCGTADYCDGTTKKCTARAAVGEACGSAPRCQSGLYCIGYKAGSMGQPEVKGKCAAPGKAGDTCIGYFFGNTSCEPGLTCADQNGNTVCTARIAAGGECAAYDACQDGLDCIGLDVDNQGNLTAKGKCGKWLDLGETCADPNVYETGCPYDAYCETSTKACQIFGGPGADCSDQGTQGSCTTDNYYCDAAGKCSPMVALGADCVPPATQNDPDPCQTGSCDTMTKKCTLSCK